MQPTQNDLIAAERDRPAVLVFDVDGVMNWYTAVGYVNQLAVKARLPTRLVMDIVLPYSNRLCSGEIDLSTFETLVSVQLGIETTDVRWVEHYADVRINHEVARIARALKSNGVVVALMTNEDGTRGSHIRATLADLSEHFFSPTETGFSKPNPQAFEAVRAVLSEKLGIRIKFGDMKLVDDSSVHVEAARKLGMDGHIYTNPVTLALALAPELRNTTYVQMVSRRVSRLA